MFRPTARPGAAPVRLSQLPAGSRGRLHATDLADEDSAVLRALGMTEQAIVRVCKTGEPCIVQVRATRIGLARGVAQHILVIPVSDAAA